MASGGGGVMEMRILIMILLALSPPRLCGAWTRGVSTPAATTTCNINTGVATGLDAGTCASPAATCNGVADDTPAFQAFNTWAKATTTNTNAQLIELRVSGKCMFITGTNSTNFANGVKNLRLMGYGATLSNNNLSTGASFQFGGLGICHKGLSDPSGCSARIATVSSGATSVTVLDTTKCSRFIAGRWAVVTGFDLQSQFNSPYGFPPNPHYFDYVQISSTSNCATTGQIALGSALTNTYLSTWPNYNSGDAVEADPGGPATIYALDPSWDSQLDIRGITIDQVNNQTGGAGRSAIFRDITVTGANCLIPSQNGSFTIINAVMTNCDIEVDKIIDSYTLNSVTAFRITTQSSSVNRMIVSNSAMNINGTPKVANIYNSTLTSFTVGPIAYGRGDSTTCTNCKITVGVSGTGFVEDQLGAGVNNYFNFSGGVMSAPDFVNVTAIANNGSGLVRLTVSPNTTGWNNNVLTAVSNVFSSGPNSNAVYVITVVDSTHIDLQGTTFSGSVYTGAGQLQNNSYRWAVPGTNLFWHGILNAQMPAFQVTGVTQDSAGTHIATTMPGGFPTMPLTSGKANLLVQQPKWTCSGCTGVVDAVDFAGAPPNTPMYSYSKRTYTNSSSLDQHLVFGTVTSIKFNVTQAYTGSTNPLKFNMVENTVVPAGTTSFYSAFIDLRTAGLRTITPSGVTCDTGGGPIPGGCGADSSLTLPDPAAFFGANAAPQMASSPVDQPWIMSAEFIMNQGVVAP